MSDDKERPNRTVNDFQSAAELRQALRSMDVKRSADGERNVSFMHPVLQSQQIGGLVSSISEGEGSTASGELNELKSGQNLDWILENYDEKTTEVQTLGGELRRLQVLKSYLILDSERQDSFERITALAGRMFKCPMALISFVDLGRQWFMSNRGLGEVRETKRSYAFCAHAIMCTEDFFIVPDATKDPRFKDNPLVTGPPDIRFYAGAPLICPEGYKLGTLCVLDTKPRPEGLSLEEKQNLMEFASLAVQAAVDHRSRKIQDFNNPAQLIAYTAHDLVTPLTGVQLSLSLLMEDEEFKSRLSIQQREMFSTASKCTDVIARICQTAIDSFRNRSSNGQTQAKQGPNRSGPSPIAISDLVKSLYMVMDPFPKQVPLIISVHPSVPESIITDDLRVFRSAVNFLTNACSKTESGTVRLSIYTKTENNGSKKVVFECEDTGPGVPVEKYPHLFKPYKDKDEAGEDVTEPCLKPAADGTFAPSTVTKIQMPNSGLGLYSVAVHISSIGGEYGFRPRGGDQPTNGKHETGSIFWFSIPLVVNEGEIDINTSNVKSAVRLLEDQGDDYRPAKVLKVLSTPNLSEEDARMVSETFTRVLEDEVPTKIAGTVQALKEAEMSESDSKPKAAASSADTASNGRQARALVIEDSLVVRKSLTRVLTKLGFETTQAVDGMEGLKEMKAILFDVVLCDFLMPVMDGLDCVQQYREWEKAHRPWFRQYIIGISAHASEKDVEKGLQLGMDDFKPKPVTYKQLSDLQKSKELKVVSDRLDEIAAEGVMTMDTVTNQEIGQSTGSAENAAESRASSSSSVHCCLIAAQDTTSDISAIEKAAEKKAWKTVVVHDGEEALRLLKMRNWDAVLMDEVLPVLSSGQCVSRFREWEEKNRVTRQKNIVLVSTSFVSNSCGSESMIQLPFGFDGALGKPVRASQLNNILSQAERTAMDFGVRDLVSR